MTSHHVFISYLAAIVLILAIGVYAMMECSV